MLKIRKDFIAEGPQMASDKELLTIVLSAHLSQEKASAMSDVILSEYGYSLSSILKGTFLRLKNTIGKKYATIIFAALELGRRQSLESMDESPTVDSSQVINHLLNGELASLKHEEFWLVALDRRNKVIKKVKIHSGGQACVPVDPRMIFRKALELGASSVIVAHNHPSGFCSPSQADFVVTEKLQKAGDALELKLLDHVIISRNGYYSFADNGDL